MRLEYGIWTLELMRSAGVSIVAGSDVAIHMSRPAALFRELQLLSEGGLSNVEAVRSATTMAAVRLGHPADVGRLTIGAPADVILLDRDPLESLDHLVRPEHLRAVFRHGERLDAQHIELRLKRTQDLLRSVKTEREHTIFYEERPRLRGAGLLPTVSHGVAQRPE